MPGWREKSWRFRKRSMPWSQWASPLPRSVLLPWRWLTLACSTIVGTRVMAKDSSRNTSANTGPGHVSRISGSQLPPRDYGERRCPFAFAAEIFRTLAPERKLDIDTYESLYARGLLDRYRCTITPFRSGSFFTHDNVLYHSIPGSASPREFFGAFVRDAGFRLSEANTFVNTCRLLRSNRPRRVHWRCFANHPFGLNRDENHGQLCASRRVLRAVGEERDSHAKRRLWLLEQVGEESVFVLGGETTSEQRVNALSFRPGRR